MTHWEISLFMLCTSFCFFVYIKSYSKIFKKSNSAINYKMIFPCTLLLVIQYYNTFSNYGFSKILISAVLMFMMLFIMFRKTEKPKTIFKKFISLYLLGWIIETLLGIIFAYFFIKSVQQFDQNVSYKLIFSTFMMIIILLCSYTTKVQKIVNSVYEYMKKTINLAVLSILFIVILVVLTFYLIVSNEIFSSITIIILICILSFLFILLIIQSIKTKKADEKQEILLNFMKEYEIIIDKERIDRHEMINNLLVLKSIKNKNAKEYDKVLDDILLTYKSKFSIKGLYDLPSGLKGLLYYKIYDMKNKDIEVFANFSNKVVKDLEKLTTKSLTKVCKILGILLDNAREAAEKAKEKVVIIDAYKENNNTIIYIENTMQNKDKNIDLNKIKDKGFSTKGKNRGYGLYLVDKLINEANIKLIQEIKNNKFVSTIKIKK